MIMILSAKVECLSLEEAMCDDGGELADGSSLLPHAEIFGKLVPIRPFLIRVKLDFVRFNALVSIRNACSLFLFTSKDAPRLFRATGVTERCASERIVNFEQVGFMKVGCILVQTEKISRR